jgi:nucleotide-binding universal stress UspA family protein
MTTHRDQLDRLAVALLTHETLDQDDAYAAAGIAPPRSVPAAEQRGGGDAPLRIGRPSPDAARRLTVCRSVVCADQECGLNRLAEPRRRGRLAVSYQPLRTTRYVMFTKVIWATDGSEHADRAMPLAVQVAKADGAELHVVHVVEKLVGTRVAGMDALVNEDEIKDKVKRQAKAIAAERGVKTSIQVVAALGNHVADRIAEVAQDGGADLIVVGTRGHGALGAFVLGGVTQRLLHVSPCPVLAVPPGVAAEAQESTESAVTAG